MNGGSGGSGGTLVATPNSGGNYGGSGGAAYEVGDNSGAGADGRVEITYTVPTTQIKTGDGVAEASVKTYQGTALASLDLNNGLVV